MSEENKNNNNDFNNEDTPEIKVEELFDNERASGFTGKERKISFSTFLISAVALVVAAVMLTYTLCSSFYKKELAELKLQNAVLGAEGPFDELELISEIFKAYSYAGVDEDEIMENVLKAYVNSTGDRYAEYYNAEEYKALRADTAGESEGIGINVIYSTVTANGYEYKTIEVIAVTPNSPAEEAGLMVGDHIVWAGLGEERELVETLGYTATLSALKGEAGTVANFTILRKNGELYEEKEFSVERRKVESVSVYYSVSDADDTVGIVKISQFDLTVPKQFSSAMDSLIEDGCTKFVFDVRNNPGGDLESIVAVLSYFLDEGDKILSTENNAKKEEIITVKEKYHSDEDYKACDVNPEDIGKYKGFEIAVLCNNSTASAAELFTAAMRDYELAQIVGVTTYGKGSMQSILSLASFGYGGALKLTTKMYFPPCGEGYDGIGIKPHTEVELSEEAKKYNIYVLPQQVDNQLIAAIATFEN